MTPEQHRAFLEAVRGRLEADPDVLGLVALGSSSGLPPLPDAFSDHDLFVVVRPGAQERFRTRLDWLAGPAEIALAYRETAHGVKVLLPSGHLVELAVFDADELGLAKVNRYRVVLDRADVAARMAGVRAASEAALRAAPPVDEPWRAGQLLTNLVVGAGRAARGERLSGHQLVRVHALEHLVVLLRARLPPDTLARLDDLDRFRRLERAVPALAAELEAVLRRGVIDAAGGLLAVAARERPDLVAPAARAAVERALESARAAGG